MNINKPHTTVALTVESSEYKSQNLDSAVDHQGNQSRQSGECRALGRRASGNWGVSWNKSRRRQRKNGKIWLRPENKSQNINKKTAPNSKIKKPCSKYETTRSHGQWTSGKTTTTTKKKRNTFLTRERMCKKLEVIRNVMKEVLCICNFLFQWEKGKQMWKSQKNKRTKDVLTSFVLFHYELS